MRLLSSILLSVILLQSAGPIVLLQMQQKQVRREMKRLIRAGLPEERLERFVFKPDGSLVGGGRVEWIEPHEFRHRGVMYDIARTEHENEYTVHLCVRDDAETAVYAQLDRLAREEQNNNPERRRQSTRLLQLMQLPALEAAAGVPAANLAVAPLVDMYLTPKILRGDFSPPTPPPEA